MDVYFEFTHSIGFKPTYVEPVVNIVCNSNFLLSGFSSLSFSSALWLFTHEVELAPLRNFGPTTFLTNPQYILWQFRPDMMDTTERVHLFKHLIRVFGLEDPEYQIPIFVQLGNGVQIYLARAQQVTYRLLVLVSLHKARLQLSVECLCSERTALAFLQQQTWQHQRDRRWLPMLAYLNLQSVVQLLKV